MSCLGVHFALTEKQLQLLTEASGDEELRAVIEGIEEEEWDESYTQETDKAWDAIHRCLSDGSLNPGAGSYPLNRTILGGSHLYQGEH